MTNLDELNLLLRAKELDLPSFRTIVDKSGSNLPWLRKHVAKNPNISDRLKELLEMNSKELLEEQ